MKHDQTTSHFFAPDLSSDRINQLFQVLQSKEKEYGLKLSDLGVVAFKQLVKDKLSFSGNQAKTSPFTVYRDEAKSFLEINQDKLTASNGFVDYLRNVSNFYSFNSSFKKMTHEPYRKEGFYL